MKNIGMALVLLMLSGAVSAQDVLRCNMDHPGGSKEQGVMSLSAAGEMIGFTWLFKTRTGASCDIRADSFRVLHNELLEGRNGCQMMLWRQGSRITLALSPATPTCQSYCSSRDAYEALLPVSFDARGAGCAM